MESIKQERNFVNEHSISKYLKCTICSAVFDEPTRLKCGHTFCKPCIVFWLKDHPNCPQCRANTKQKDFQSDRIAAGIISELAVYCLNRNYGCKWKGVIDNLQIHQKKCSAKSDATQLNLKMEYYQENDEDYELAQSNDPGNIGTRILAKLKDKGEVIDALKSSNENTKDDNLEENDPMLFLDELQKLSENIPLEEQRDKLSFNEKRETNFDDEDLPKQCRERINKQSNM
ncbi:unnamed protein product (macronuclear) [Paramecium tetraurelia]|uniref:RING-type domain-containing protein n=1 Tax=Paramecium tetraurelia TaxID=5888 RepID=A0DRC8_PARTE|nr:uncharacterized protein GSPATT00019312001 [Paramecium tetraurelia]CAK85595.1 unnamed protein product [Paramecium tetraurelia]|eukprot:XP_001452992.1 hypothetical protein (macronuclear) [Paramecium tetraurelia strain d4-2]